MRKLFFLAGCLLALSSVPALAQNASSVAVVRVVETNNKVHISIVRGSADPEFMEFEGGLSSKRAPQIAVEYQRVMSRLYAEGYQLQGTIGEALSGTTEVSRTLLFVKAPKP